MTFNPSCIRRTRSRKKTRCIATDGSSSGAFLFSSEEDDRAAQLEVRDSGAGIADENLLHVFERFFREDQSRSRKTGGAGLGLAICKSIVDAADGSIEIRSERGKGTTVTASFRLA